MWNFVLLSSVLFLCMSESFPLEESGILSLPNLQVLAGQPGQDALRCLLGVPAFVPNYAPKALSAQWATEMPT